MIPQTKRRVTCNTLSKWGSVFWPKKGNMSTAVDFGDFVLRRFVATDAVSLAEAANDPRISQNLRDRFPYPYDIQDAHYFIEVVCANDSEPIWAIADATGVIGSIGLHVNEDVHRYSAELGYWLKPDRWGRGIATRAVRHITEMGFQERGLRRVYAMVYETNPASMRVLEKVGFLREGVMRSHVTKRGQLLDAVLYAMTRSRFGFLSASSSMVSSAGASWGMTNTIDLLRTVMVHPPQETLLPGDIPARWGYEENRDSPRALAQFDRFRQLLESEGTNVIVNEAVVAGDLDAVYQCDSAVMTPHGAVVFHMGKVPRRQEAAHTRNCLESLAVPIVGEITAPGTMEGGDVIWLRADCVAVGLGYRTNREGVAQFQALMAPFGIRVRPVELPYGPGPEHCLHLRSLINVLRPDLAVVYKPWLSASFIQELEVTGLQLLDAVPEEMATQGNNLLVVRPNRVVMVAGNPHTEKLLSAHGVEVLAFEADELCIKGSGGPTCLCLDLWRRSLRL